MVQLKRDSGERFYKSSTRLVPIESWEGASHLQDFSRQAKPDDRFLFVGVGFNLPSVHISSHLNFPTACLSATFIRSTTKRQGAGFPTRQLFVHSRIEQLPPPHAHAAGAPFRGGHYHGHECMATLRRVIPVGLSLVILSNGCVIECNTVE
jgi:hypothetical protein